MCNLNALARNSVLAQERMFRLAERDHGLSCRVLHLETGIPKTTLESWKGGTTMPAWAVGALGRSRDGRPLVPDYLLSLVLHPFNKHVGTDGNGEGALDDLARETAGFTSEYLQAKCPSSDAGHKLSPREKAQLNERALRVVGVGRAVAA